MEQSESRWVVAYVDRLTGRGQAETWPDESSARERAEQLEAAAFADHVRVDRRS